MLFDQRQPFDERSCLSGRTPEPTESTTPLKVRLWLVITVIRATPGRTLFRSVSRKCSDHIPAVVIQQGKDRLQRRGVLADGGFQRHHYAVEGRTHFGKFQMQFGEGGFCARIPARCATMASNAGHGRRGLSGLQQAWPPVPPAPLSAVRPDRDLPGGKTPAAPARSRRVRVEVVCLTSALARSTAAATDWALYSCALMVRWVSMICSVEWSLAALSRHRASPDRGGGRCGTADRLFFTRWLSRMGISTMRPLTSGTTSMVSA